MEFFQKKETFTCIFGSSLSVPKKEIINGVLEHKTISLLIGKYLTADRNPDSSLLTLKFQEALFEKQGNDAIWLGVWHSEREETC